MTPELQARQTHRFAARCLRLGRPGPQGDEHLRRSRRGHPGIPARRRRGRLPPLRGRKGYWRCRGQARRARHPHRGRKPVGQVRHKPTHRRPRPQAPGPVPLRDDRHGHAVHRPARPVAPQPDGFRLSPARGTAASGRPRPPTAAGARRDAAPRGSEAVAGAVPGHHQPGKIARSEPAPVARPDGHRLRQDVHRHFGRSTGSSSTPGPGGFCSSWTAPTSASRHTGSFSSTSARPTGTSSPRSSTSSTCGTTPSTR